MAEIKKVNVKGKIRHLSGFKRQSTDERDKAYSFKSSPTLMGAAAVTSNNLLQNNLPVVDQGDLGSCTANAFAGVVGINELTASKKLSLSVTSPTPSVASAVSLSADGKTLTVTSTITNFVTPVTTTTLAPTTTHAPTTTIAPTTHAPTTTIAPTTTHAPVTTTVAPAPVPSTPILASRLFEYYNARSLEGTTSEDSGATIRDTIKAAAQYGVAHESLWPYNISVFATKPPTNVYTEAATHLVASYHAIADGDLASMKAAIIAGYGIEFGFDVYSSFLSDTVANTGIVPLPNTKTEILEGGHAVVLVGFDDATQNFLVRNSWGTAWGLLQTGTSAPVFGGTHLTAPGYFLMPYSYVGNTSLCSDFWVVVSNVLNS